MNFIKEFMTNKAIKVLMTLNYSNLNFGKFEKK